MYLPHSSGLSEENHITLLEDLKPEARRRVLRALLIERGEDELKTLFAGFTEPQLQRLQQGLLGKDAGQRQFRFLTEALSEEQQEQWLLKLLDDLSKDGKLSKLHGASDGVQW